MDQRGGLVDVEFLSSFFLKYVQANLINNQSI